MTKAKNKETRAKEASGRARKVKIRAKVAVRGIPEVVKGKGASARITKVRTRAKVEGREIKAKAPGEIAIPEEVAGIPKKAKWITAFRASRNIPLKNKILPEPIRYLS